MKSQSNQITENVIRQLKLQGCEAWRNNIMGIFDGTSAAKKIWNVMQSGRVTLAEIKKAIQSSYRKSHERLGVSDVLGFTRNGAFIACEVKADKDILSYEQEVFLSDVAKKGGIAFIVSEHPEKIKLRVIGSSKITICNDVDFLRLFRLRLEEPF